MASITIHGYTGREYQGEFGAGRHLFCSVLCRARLPLLTSFTVPTGLFIDNEFVAATNNTTVDIENPSTGDTLGAVSAAQAADVDKAVASSLAAFQGPWHKSKTGPEQRRLLLLKLGDLIERDGDELASIEAVDCGMLFRGSQALSIRQAVETCRYFAGWADKIQGKSMDISEGLAYTRHDPIGVCAAIVPWNAPM